MKKTGQHILLFLVVFQIITPVVPYLEYWLNKDYIAKVLCVNKDKPKSCCQGKCHLQKQLEKATQNSTEEDNPAAPVEIKKNPFVTEYFQKIIMILKPTKSVKTILPFSLESYHFIWYQVIFHPPK